ATAAACRLSGLDAARARNALGIAASMAAGSRQNFGTMTKPLHAGTAASNAVLATTLASSGFTADEGQLEAPLGYFALFGDDGNDLSRLTATLGGPWALAARGLNVKKFPCCYNTHRAADAVLALAGATGDGGEGLRAADVDSVEVTLEPAGLGPLIHHRPRTGLQGKFSLEYVTAAAILDRKLTLRTFTDAEVQRREAQDLLARVSVAESDTPPVGGAAWRHAYAAVRVTTRGGEQLTRRVDVPRGHAAQPLTDDELTAKFTDCVAFSGTGHDATALYSRLRYLRKEPAVADLVPASPAENGRAPQ
ncbi:MAG: MmgE/PrpD family protein, partial [Nocardiopsaceae bacterium]|nr:MmgE/PrpD family protein [Nocardiopsaceae bacterium]